MRGVCAIFYTLHERDTFIRACAIWQGSRAYCLHNGRSLAGEQCPSRGGGEIVCYRKPENFAKKHKKPPSCNHYKCAFNLYSLSLLVSCCLINDGLQQECCTLSWKINLCFPQTKSSKFAVFLCAVEPGKILRIVELIFP